MAWRGNRQHEISKLTEVVLAGIFVLGGALITGIFTYIAYNPPKGGDASSNETISSTVSSTFESKINESETNSKLPIVRHGTVKTIEGLPLYKDAYTLTSIDYSFFNKDDTETLRILISGDVNKIDTNKSITADIYKNIFLKKKIVKVETGWVFPDHFDVIAVIYNEDGEYISTSKATIYSDQEHFSHIAMTFDNVEEGEIFVDFF